MKRSQTERTLTGPAAWLPSRFLARAALLVGGAVVFAVCSPAAPVDPPDRCATDAECSGALTCSMGTCSCVVGSRGATCSQPTDCPTGQECASPDCQCVPEGGGGAGGAGGAGGSGGQGASVCSASLAAIAGVVDPAQLTNVEQSGTGNTTKASNDVATCVSEGQTDIDCIADAIVGDSELNFANWICGPSSLGEVVCPPGSTASAAGDGDHLAIAVVLDGTVPLADPALYYQYGWVFDSDGLPGNNFQAAPAWPADFFIDTDLWVQLLYIPGSGWEMSVSDIVGNSPVPRAASKAKILIADDVLLLLSPDEELLGSPSYPDARYRISAYRHDGNNLNGIWNGDVHPPVAQQMLSVPQP